MKELSIFVDESGDFGQYSQHAPFYLFSLVLHEQDADIAEQVEKLNQRINEHGFPPHAIHAGPIIRNEDYYRNYSPEERIQLFNDLLFFTKSVDIKYHTVFINKKQARGKTDLIIKLSKQLSDFLKDHIEYLLSFDKVIVYYDYGQSEITTMLTSAFSTLLSSVEFRHVQPYEYKLFQVADMICTLELSNINFINNKISKSELNFYGTRRRFKDFYYKSIKKKQI